ncbi:hypothetical protein Desgi_2901 [Desulfoscipio gibsoniae DSM 7213]|uniref:Uncharacterized protein n=1 Tax=Desulfoscipio gibsoniae DSM 7213 TaxID=767817 RepID=R4KI58_9FIRM|nr:hypothetical protein Desgi_2901 [Desulfoscipio gibsoniae DSM 7213]
MYLLLCAMAGMKIALHTFRLHIPRGNMQIGVILEKLSHLQYLYNFIIIHPFFTF